jgi:hypothetical protein
VENPPLRLASIQPVANIRAMKHRILHVSMLASIAASLASPVLAAAPKVLGTHQDWQAYLLVEGNRRICYMASAPQKKEPETAKRGDVLVFVTHRPADKEQDVVNFHVGYTLKANSNVRVSIPGDKTYTLFTKGETAWNREAAEDKALVQAMMKGSSMTVSGESDRGTKTTDTYSLRGFTAAYKEISKACGIK